MAGTLDGSGERPLVAGAGACLPSWADSAIFGDEAAKKIVALIIDGDILVCAELADLRARNKSAWAGKSFVFVYIFF